jgi:hypothetical protein
LPKIQNEIFSIFWIAFCNPEPFLLSVSFLSILDLFHSQTQSSPPLSLSLALSLSLSLSLLNASQAAFIAATEKVFLYAEKPHAKLQLHLFP